MAGLLQPEVVAFMAFSQRQEARELLSVVRKNLGQQPPPTVLEGSRIVWPAPEGLEDNQRP